VIERGGPTLCSIHMAEMVPVTADDAEAAPEDL